MRPAILALTLAATPALAAIEQARHLRERCEHAWFQSARDEATQALSELGATMALRIRPLAPSLPQDLAELEQVTQWLRECTAIMRNED